MTLTDFRADKQAHRKAGIFAAVVGGAMLILLWPSGSPLRPVRQPPGPVRQPPTPGGGRRGPGRGTPTTYVNGVATPDSLPSLTARDIGILGKWESGPLALQKRGLCTLWLEIGRQPEVDKYTGAASLSCLPSEFLGVKSDASGLAKLPPVLVSLSGEWQNNAIAFKVDRLLNAGNCPWTGLSVWRLGSQNLAAQFQDACGGGSMGLQPTR